MEDLNFGPIPFKDALEAAAYAVCLEQMEDVEFNIQQTEDGYELILEKPISMITHLGIMGGIAYDQKSNPKKWENTRADLEKKHGKN